MSPATTPPAESAPTAESLPWLAPAMEQLKRTKEAGRLPHGLLIQAAEGLGAEALGRWAASLAMCTSASDAPCGTCKSCVLLAAGNHPDLRWIVREEDAKQLGVDQIRELCSAMALKSYVGGYKTAVIAEADSMNTNAANALLKTLEEPPSSTLLVLCSMRPSRLPSTIISRCQRLKVARPARAAALQWLKQAKGAGSVNWEELLDHAAGAPLRAQALARSGFADLDGEMRSAVADLKRRALDVPTTAEKWAKGELGPRLDWFETWITNALRGALVPGTALPSAAGTQNIRRLFKLLDRVRGLKLELSTSLNVQLMAEQLLLSTEAALAS